MSSVAVSHTLTCGATAAAGTGSLGVWQLLSNPRLTQAPLYKGL